MLIVHANGIGLNSTIGSGLGCKANVLSTTCNIYNPYNHSTPLQVLQEISLD